MEWNVMPTPQSPDGRGYRKANYDYQMASSRNGAGFGEGTGLGGPQAPTIHELLRWPLRNVPQRKVVRWQAAPWTFHTAARPNGAMADQCSI
jgi:hypothetical protein